MSYVENILESKKGLTSAATATSTTATATAVTTTPPQFIKQAKSKEELCKTFNKHTKINVFYI